MKSPTLATAARQSTSGRRKVMACALFCVMTILVFTQAAIAQTIINPPTTSIQYGGIPNANNVVSDFTTPRGGIVMYGTAISAFTGKPVRHLWVGDNIHGICRTDPEIDDPSFHSIQLTTCIFKLNGASVTGGPMVIDPTPRACIPDGTPQTCNFLYLADVRNSEGIFRLSYWPAGDSGHGFLDFTNIFAMAGNPTAARFQGGQTGCQFPLNTTLTPTTLTAPITNIAITAGVLTVTAVNTFPIGAKVTFSGLGVATFLNGQQVTVTASSPTDFSAAFNHADFPSTPDVGTATSFTLPKTGSGDNVALGPDGNLYVGFKRNGAIIRINSPATATSTGFGTCNDFVQVVATTPDNRRSNGLAWLGHNLWGLDGTGPFVIVNADTTCQALGLTPTTSPTCVGDGTQLAAAAGAAALDGDQNYPALNGDNLYFGLGVPGNTVWATNVTGGPAVQQVDPAIIDTAQLVAAFLAFPTPLGNIGGEVVDRTDPANLISFAGEDFSTVGALGAGRWFETCQGIPPVAGAFNCPTPTATAAPGAPTVARAAGRLTSIQVSWTPAQSAQPVTSYTVRNTLASNGILLADVIVGPGPSGFPPTSTTISAGLVNTVSYAFSVAATNGSGTSAFSGQSNSATFPTLAKPGIPTSTQATAGDGAALVTWTPPSFAGDAPITSYTATAIANNVVTGITSTVAAPNTSAVVTGLTNGVKYTFSVHATNAGGNSMESTPSDPPVIPATQANQVSVGVTGVSTLGITPVQITYPITIHNNTPFPITSTSLSVNLSQVVPDGAFIILVQPTVGTCSGGGLGITLVTCNLGGTLAPLATVSANAIVQIQTNGVTLTGTFNGIDTGLNPVSAVGSFTTAPAPPPTVTVSAAISVTGNAQVPNPNVGQAGNIVWTISDVTQTRADHVIFTNVLPAGLILNTITFTENNPTNGVLTCVYTPTGGLAVPCPAGAIGSNVGATIQVFAEPGLGGSTKNGAKPPQTLIVTTNVTAPNSHGAVFHPTGTVSFGPGGVDTLPNNATVTITVK